jgi:hypothetical protein
MVFFDKHITNQTDSPITKNPSKSFLFEGFFKVELGFIYPWVYRVTSLPYPLEEDWYHPINEP